MIARDIEEIRKLLKNTEGVEVIDKEDVAGEFNREIEFIIRNKYYTIEWWANQSYIHCGLDTWGDAVAPFRYVEVKTTNCKYRKSLDFGQGLKDVVFSKTVDTTFTIPVVKNSNI